MKALVTHRRFGGLFWYSFDTKELTTLTLREKEVGDFGDTITFHVKTEFIKTANEYWKKKNS